MNKRGLSTVISTFLFLMLLLVIVAIVWGTVSSIVKKSSEEISLGKFSIDLKIVNVYSEAGKLFVNVQREKGAGDLKGIKFIVEGNGLQETFEEETSMNEFDASKFDFTLTKFSPINVSKVSVAPILSSGVGNVLDVWEKPKSGVSCTSLKTCDSEGYNCGEFTNDCGEVVSCGEESQSCSEDFGSCTSVAGERTCSNNLLGDCNAVDPRIATCGGKECGSDGCEGTCGECDSGEVCNNGICEEKKLVIFVSATKTTGDLKKTFSSALEGADAICNNDPAKPSGEGRTFKALIGTSTRQVMTSRSSDWVLLPDRDYYRVDGVTKIAKTNSNAWFNFSAGLINSINSTGLFVWTGLESNGLLSTNCVSWSSYSSSSTGKTGYSTYKTFNSIALQSYRCDYNSFRLYCVEQP